MRLIDRMQLLQKFIVKSSTEESGCLISILLKGIYEGIRPYAIRLLIHMPQVPLLLREAGAGGSNLLTPTKLDPNYN